VRSLGLQRAPDTELVQRARTDQSIIITFDLDFGDVLALGVLDKPSVIIFRLASCLLDGDRSGVQCCVMSNEPAKPVDRVKRTAIEN
jgi:hypothetical protein